MVSKLLVVSLLFASLLPVSGFVVHSVRPRRICSALFAAAADGTVLVVGGTSGIGQLVTDKLTAAGTPVRATTRNVAKAKEILNENAQVVELDLLSEDPSVLQAAVQGVSAVVISVGTTAFPTLKWRGGNTPQAIDQVAVTKIAEAVSKEPSVKKVVMV